MLGGARWAPDEMRRGPLGPERAVLRDSQGVFVDSAGEAVQVLRLQQGLQPEARPGRAQEDAHGGEAVPV